MVMLSWERVYEIDIIYSSTDILPQIEREIIDVEHKLRCVLVAVTFGFDLAFDMFGKGLFIIKKFVKY